MDGPTHRFSISGRNPIVRAVELPPWLPRDTMEVMVACFERFLRDQIFTMMLDRMKERNSEQDALSTASSCMYVPGPYSNVEGQLYHDDMFSDSSSEEEDRANAPIMPSENIST
jgi:hypothetical protein